MTPEDFLRSLIPGEKQPEHLGLDHHIQVTEEESTEGYQKMAHQITDNTGIFKDGTSHLGNEVATGARPSPSGNKGTDWDGPSYPSNRGRTGAGAIDHLFQVTEEQRGAGLSYIGNRRTTQG